MRHAPRLFRPLDLLVPLAVLALALSLLLFPLLGGRETGSYLRVTYEEGSFTLPLSEDCERTVVSNGYTVTVTVKDGYARVTDSDCPDGLCRKMGRISHKGETILCAKADVLVRVVSEGGDFDGVAE